MFPLMFRNGGISNSKTAQVIQQILEVGRVGVAVSSSIGLKISQLIHIRELPIVSLTVKSYVCLHMNVIPGDTVVLTSGDTPAHCEHQPLSPGHVDTMQSLLPLRCV